MKSTVKLIVLFAVVPLLFFGCATQKTHSKQSEAQRLPTAPAKSYASPQGMSGALKKETLRNKKVNAKNGRSLASESKSMYEQLSGKADLKKLNSAQRALVLARESRSNRDYIMAIKRYNFIVKNFPRSKEAKQALLDKSAMYTQMGLKDQAQYNRQRAMGKTSASVVKSKRAAASNGAVDSKNKGVQK